jgi:membrane protein implicated in regulation of membrane protease activity
MPYRANASSSYDEFRSFSTGAAWPGVVSNRADVGGRNPADVGERCDHGAMPDWLVWLIAAAVFAAAEAASLTFVLVMFAGGAAAAAIVAAVGGPVLLQCIIAIVATVALLGGVRPIARKHLTAGTGTTTGPEALVGTEAVVLSEVDSRDGRVRLNGAEWSARAFDHTQVLPAGTVVRVMKITGATAIVLHEGPYFEQKS